MTDGINKVIELIQKSDKILIGIGEEFSCEMIDLTDSNAYQAYLNKKSVGILNEDEWIIEHIKNYHINSELNLDTFRIFRAYQKLFELIREKDYYIVNMNLDSLLKRAGFLDKRVVYPCGTKSLYQCSNNCSNLVWENAEIEYQIIQNIFNKNIRLSEIERPLCENCGRPAIYNTVGVYGYCESGYLDRWSDYTQWIAHSLNRSICVLELGVGFKYPTVIRWPFEKITFINNNAHLIRINEKWNQVSEELTNKAITIKENAVNFLIK
ncbi:hypothetical protein C8E03_1173 [Lachnotalea glycerini]|uniref:Uncharacterized protein n=1 Tax=Lachnotalea glycerini TaxID=1763509 RepID=A0A255I0J2_9FIRM|nr:hypothetical protein [Lachnotalea glycerini]PXV85367.1 hypothetical protein C8E03_1173 [Lachnotalea glycerini]RDY26580.1 hypothetical protein CG710_021615 [Lachnotalea glycerini]